MADNVEKLNEALENIAGQGDWRLGASEIRAALSAAGLEVNKVGTREALTKFGHLHCKGNAHWPDDAILTVQARGCTEPFGLFEFGSLRTAAALTKEG
ncbi:hypothetical protein [Henriciella sp.]|uniref:hypothetical protein n=1 Tax=Henriciella sp. TaxID=1968823 RepID=UPI000C113000|nr:hypothetical protein [Henriciella sp.]PHR83145.1 MAG: hypothetical protein COA64_00370 [Henriciella sp.]